MMITALRKPRFGFTIVELMVVVSLIALLIGVSVPLVFKIDEMSRDRTGINSIGVAVTGARAYATRRIADSLTPAEAEYSGAAVLVTPMNVLRIISDDQSLETGGKSSYVDIAKIDPISTPRGVGIVGITRFGGSAAANFVLLPPPFVIRFNKNGQLVAEGNGALTNEAVRNLIYYEGGTSTRPAGYSPVSAGNLANNYDPDAASIEQQWVAASRKYKLPFAVMESVIGVITYSKADFEDAGGKFPDGVPANIPTLGCLDGSCGSITEWMFDNGNVIFFSRNTGTIMRINRP